MASQEIRSGLGQVLIDFSTDGRFPEEEKVSSAYAESIALSSALDALSAAKSDLEVEIRQISHNSSSDVDDWIANAKSIQDDIKKSRDLANEIVKQAEADEERLEGLQEKETYAGFLDREVSYNARLLGALRAIQDVHAQLVGAEELVSERKIHEALLALEGAWKSCSHIPLEKSARAMRLLDAKCFDVRQLIHDQFNALWRALVHIDTNTNTITIHESISGESTGLEHVIIGLKSYKEVDKVASKLWDDLDNLIVKPRTEIGFGPLPSIQITENSLTLGDATEDQSIKALFDDLGNIIQFLTKNLPPDIIKPFSRAMMPRLSNRILESWLDTAVPSSLGDMVDYQKALAQVHQFATELDSLEWPGIDGFHDWVDNAPKIWLNKRRESSMDWTRNQLSLGVGIPVAAERVETRMVARDEGHQIAAAGPSIAQDWDAGWESDGEEKHEPAESKRQASLEEERKMSSVVAPAVAPITDDDQEDDAADAWGWGDDDLTDPDQTEKPDESSIQESRTTLHGSDTKLSPDTREMTLSEKYWTSSMPGPVLNTVKGIYDDGARLTQPATAHLPIAPAAAGLFSLPTLILAMYRATSPYYYAFDPCGNMYLYNDSIWLSEKLKEFVLEWQKRTDLSSRAYGMVRLDADIKILESFGKRAYTSELNAQRTIISDLLGGAQNFFQQEGIVKGELENSIQSVIQHIRGTASSWEKVLPYSAWASATGSMVNAVASKLINDVFEMSDIGVDEAERTATILSQVETLDNLFIRATQHGQNNGGADEDRIPITYQFADKWMKMKFLSEVLQSNLKDVKFLWFDSDLSLYFTLEEVVDLINLSFESNAAVRQAIKEIREKPTPKGYEF